MTLSVCFIRSNGTEITINKITAVTKAEAERIIRKRFSVDRIVKTECVKRQELYMTVYIVRNNTDTTEGRGPMQIQSVQLDLEKAKRFVESRLGIMGSKFRSWAFYEKLECNETYKNSDYNDNVYTFPNWKSHHGWDIMVIETRF